MKITAIETIRLASSPNLVWVEVQTDEGVTGLGETFYGPGAVEGHIHDTLAPMVLGKDPLRINEIAQYTVGYVGFVGASAEMRGASAFDIALWDLWGKASGQPIHQLLGGSVRDSIPVYNTCAGTRYVQDGATQDTRFYGIGTKDSRGYEDLDAFLNNADELALSLLEMGITGMKIWPFDFAAERWRGSHITGEELEKALEPFAKIRKAVGDRMNIMVELHAMWHLTPVRRIAAALEEFNPFWIEDPVKMDHLSSIGVFSAGTSVPVATGETLGGIGQFRSLLEMEAIGYAIMDLAWAGGFTVAHKVAGMAESWHTPITFHDCTGPVALAACVHAALAFPNSFVQEVVRAFYYGWYGDIVTQLPPLKNGIIEAPSGPGLGLSLQPDVKTRTGARVRRSELG
ncbi:MAG: mandelate racemase/muconate lactonizing enzyme family protein [Dehalococcoidia bacterium]|nr:mandelate racemase/muconate lactonizing enzyme family protein [Dehalococcoidia bacterium]